MQSAFPAVPLGTALTAVPGMCSSAPWDSCSCCSLPSPRCVTAALLALFNGAQCCSPFQSPAHIIKPTLASKHSPLIRRDCSSSNGEHAKCNGSAPPGFNSAFLHCPMAPPCMLRAIHSPKEGICLPSGAQGSSMLFKPQRRKHPGEGKDGFEGLQSHFAFCTGSTGCCWEVLHCHGQTYVWCSVHQPQCGSPELRHSAQVVYCSQDSTGTRDTCRDKGQAQPQRVWWHRAAAWGRWLSNTKAIHRLGAQADTCAEVGQQYALNCQELWGAAPPAQWDTSLRHSTLPIHLSALKKPQRLKCGGFGHG